jgi:hypothetical protein
VTKRLRLVISIALSVAVVTAVVVVNKGRARDVVQPHKLMSHEDEVRKFLFEELQPVKLANCTLERFGEPHDGGYLMCGNLLGSVEAAYSYGIAGYDGWGCDISRRAGVKVHEYDCFDTRRPICSGGELIFHEECVAGEPGVEEGRVFRTVQSQFVENGDDKRRLVVKMDVETAEWDTLLRTPPEVLDRIDQFVLEFHGVQEDRFVLAVLKLKELFHVAHLHFNNFSCSEGVEPFPATAYEVLFVSKRLGRLDRSGKPTIPNPFDSVNNPDVPDCQASRPRP